MSAAMGDDAFDLEQEVDTSVRIVDDPFATESRH